MREEKYDGGKRHGKRDPVEAGMCCKVHVRNGRPPVALAVLKVGHHTNIYSRKRGRNRRDRGLVPGKELQPTCLQKMEDSIQCTTWSTISSAQSDGAANKTLGRNNKALQPEIGKCSRWNARLGGSVISNSELYAKRAWK